MKSVVGKLLMSLLLLLPVGMTAAADNHAALVLVSTGRVDAVDASGKQRALGRRAPVFVGDTVVTGPQSVAQLKFTDGSLVAMKADTQLRIERYATRENGGKDAFGVSVLKGGFRSLTGAIGKRSPDEYKVGARVATIGIRGTDYEIDLDLDSGLGLGVWNGVIEACNDAGCLALGGGKNFRFGFVPIQGGAPEGRREPPANVGSGTLPASPPPSGPDAQAPAGQVVALDPLKRGRSVVKDDESAIIPSPGAGISDVLNPVLGHLSLENLRGKYPLQALGMARTTTSPLGDSYAAHFATIEAPGTSFAAFHFTDPLQTASWSADASTLLVDGSNYGGPTWDIRNWMIGTADETPVYSLYAEAGATTFNGKALAAESLAVVGQYVPPEVVSPLHGTMTLALSPNPHRSALEGMSLLHMVDGTVAGTGVGTLDASLRLGVDFSAATAAGELAFSDSFGRWKLQLHGAVNSAGLALAVGSSSVFRPWQESVDYGVSGHLDSRFIGQTTVDGLLGTFRAVTEPVLTAESTLQASGVFVAEAFALPARSEFPLHALAVSTTAGTVLGDIHHAAFGLVDSLPNAADPAREDIFDFGFTDDGINYLTKSGNPQAQGSAVAEGWRVANQTLVGFVTTTDPQALVYGDPVWGEAVGETVFTAFGNHVDPALVSSLTGVMSFGLAADPAGLLAVRYEQDGLVGTPAFASLFLDVDFTAATASGNLSIGDSLGTWSLGLDGSVTGSGLALAVAPGTDGGSVGSHYTPVATAGGPSLGVTGTASALFVGSTAVDGVLGAFRASTLPGAQQPHAIHGAFVGVPQLLQ